MERVQIDTAVSLCSASGGGGAADANGLDIRPWPNPHPRSHSPSALKMYMDCRRRYAYAYLLRPEIDEEPSANLVVGEAIHRALAHLFRLPPHQRSIGAAHDALRGYWRQCRCPGAFSSREEEAVRGELALGMLTDYCGSTDLSVKPLALEQWVRADLRNGRRLAGRVDRIDPIAGGGVEVIDYKTGRIDQDEESLPEDLAAQVYALCVERAFRRPVRRVTYIYLNEGERVRWEIERGYLEAIEEQLCDLTDEIPSGSYSNLSRGQCAGGASTRSCALALSP